MSHIAKLSSLTDEVITVITGLSYSSDSNKFNTYRESALRVLRSSNYARTNQFDIQHQLDGLEEKFRVYNEDELANALRERRDELAKQPLKWAPEILHLMLELSDKPVVNLELENLEFLKPLKPEAQPRYRWEDLAAEDPLLRDKDVWRNIDYGAESSDDEARSLDSDAENSTVTEITTLSSIHDDQLHQTRHITTSAGIEALGILETTQFWRDTIGDKVDLTRPNIIGLDTKQVSITELQAIREILFLLSGLPTSVFDTSERVSAISHPERDVVHTPTESTLSAAKGHIVVPVITPNPQFALKHVSNHVFREILVKFAQCGTSIKALRSWTGFKQTIPLLQYLQKEVAVRLQQVDRHLSELQATYLLPRKDLIVSLVEMQAEVFPFLRPILEVSKLVKMLVSEPYSHAFRCLELLYDMTCNSQMVGDDYMYEFIGKLFFDCFQVYLRPIRRWIEEGELPRNDNIFFVSEATKDTDLASLWQNRYKLLRTHSGVLHAPRFLHPASTKIFTTGKSVVVLKQLGRYEGAKSASRIEEPNLDFKTVCLASPESLAPFPELFDVAFDQWIQSKHHVTSLNLRQCLFDDCGLKFSLSALEKIYFMADGAVATSLTNSIFEKLDSGKRSWNDRFKLTELARATIGGLPDVIAERLRSSVNIAQQSDVQNSRKTVKSLNAITFTYNLPWPVQIVITNETVPSYQNIFSFLLQIRRSVFLLQGERLGKASREVDEDTLYYGLRSRLLWFNSTLYSYLTDLVIHTNTIQMRAALAEGEDVDQMIEVHRSYMRKLINQALLGTRLEPIHKTIITILDLSTQLSNARTTQMLRQDPKEVSAALAQAFSLRQPLVADPRVGQQQSRSRREFDSSDDDEPDLQAESGIVKPTEVRRSYMEELEEMKSQFDRHCRFVSLGLRGVARAGGEPNWDMLADKLDSGLGVAA